MDVYLCLCTQLLRKNCPFSFEELEHCIWVRVKGRGLTFLSLIYLRNERMQVLRRQQYKWPLIVLLCISVFVWIDAFYCTLPRTCFNRTKGPQFYCLYSNPEIWYPVLWVESWINCKYLFFVFGRGQWVTPNSTHDLLLTLLRDLLVMLRKLYAVPGIEPGRVVCQSIVFTSVLVLIVWRPSLPLILCTKS